MRALGQHGGGIHKAKANQVARRSPCARIKCGKREIASACVGGLNANAQRWVQWTVNGATRKTTLLHGVAQVSSGAECDIWKGIIGRDGGNGDIDRINWLIHGGGKNVRAIGNVIVIKWKAVDGPLAPRRVTRLAHIQGP